ncbi:MAG: hypothetical protein WCP28_13495 [Actinomycetes bacterium]
MSGHRSPNSFGAVGSRTGVALAAALVMAAVPAVAASAWAGSLGASPGNGAGGAIGSQAAGSTARPIAAVNLNLAAVPGLTPRAFSPTQATSKVLPGTKCRVFPASSVWHSDISALPISPRSAQWMANSDANGRNLHPDFGPSFGEQPVPYGIPITIVKSKKKPSTKVTFEYADESDRVRYPLSAQTKIEGGAGADGDRHAIMVYAKTCKLYETWSTRKVGRRWTAGSGAVWSLRSNKLRPSGWTSADAAGLPILPGLLRWDEIVSGRIDHAIRFTLPETQDSFVWPARHRAGSTDDPAFPPMGARFRLSAAFDTAGFSRSARVVLEAMKRYGMVLADNGSAWYFQGTSDTRWPDALISELKDVPASSFEAVDAAPLQITANSAAARP